LQLRIGGWDREGAAVASRGENGSRIEQPAVNLRLAVLDVATGRFVQPAWRKTANAMRDGVVEVRRGEVVQEGEARPLRDCVAARSDN
jgi:hypothetical protein